MKKKHYALIINVAIIAILFFTSGCEYSSATISDAKVCTSLNGNICNSDDVIISGNPAILYASCALKYAPENTEIKFSWYYYGQTKIEIDNVILNSGANGTDLDVFSSLSRPNNGWPSGDYEVVIQLMIQGKDPLVKQFRIQ